MKTISILFIIASIIASSCCAFCEIESTVKYEIDTVYHSDTVEVDIISDWELKLSNDLYMSLLDLIEAREIIDSLLKLPPDTLTIIRLGDIPLPISSDTIHAETDYAEAFAGLTKGDLWLYMQNKERAEFILDSLKTIIISNSITTMHVKDSNSRLKDKFKRYRFIAFISTGLLIFFIVLIIAYRKVIIKGMNLK